MSAGSYSAGMGFLPPMAVTLANMTTNVPASALPAWAAGTSYALGAEVIDASRVIWRSLLAGNVGNAPATTSGKWQNRGVENRLRMFDASLGTSTERADLIEFTVAPGRVVTDIQFLGLQAYSVQVTMTDPVHGLLFDSGELPTLTPSGSSHWGYFFAPIERQSKLLVSGLPAYTGASVTVRIRNAGAMARCAEVVIGRAVWLGRTQWRPSIGFDDWSLKKRDEWGGWVASPGAYSERMKLQVLMQGTQYERARDLIVAWRARPVVWFGARGYGVLTTYGYVTGFEQVLVAHGISDCNLTIEGLEQ